MSKKFDVAVVGATGAVGEVMLSILAERNFPVEKFMRWLVVGQSENVLSSAINYWS